MLAIIGGPAQRFAPFADPFRRVLEESGAAALPVAVHSPGHVGDTDELAREQLYPHFKVDRDRIGAERGWGPMALDEYHSGITYGALYVGSGPGAAGGLSSPAPGPARTPDRPLCGTAHEVPPPERSSVAASGTGWTGPSWSKPCMSAAGVWPG